MSPFRKETDLRKDSDVLKVEGAATKVSLFTVHLLLSNTKYSRCVRKTMHKIRSETKGLFHLTLTWTHSCSLPLADTSTWWWQGEINLLGWETGKSSKKIGKNWNSYMLVQNGAWVRQEYLGQVRSAGTMPWPLTLNMRSWWWTQEAGSVLRGTVFINTFSVCWPRSHQLITL